MRETGKDGFQTVVRKRIEAMFPDSVVIKQNPTMFQGLPDLLVLYNDHWAMLETKASKSASRRPNQSYWVQEFNKMSFAAFVYPENLEDVLYALQHAFRS